MEWNWLIHDGTGSVECGTGQYFVALDQHGAVPGCWYLVELGQYGAVLVDT